MKEVKVKQKQVVEDNINIVLKSLGMSEQKYLNIQYENSVCWLIRKLDIKDARLLNKIACLPLFTKWWNNQWAIREAFFVRECNLMEINEELTGEIRMAAGQLFYEMHDSTAMRVTLNVWVQKEIYDFIKLETKREEHNF